ncbi:general transcriptional corepressor trfA-like [Crassostrea angulata]|uniref:general transcriptional corepressor trfA-like n=1 Tax=Magallana angulata TaxID=2784310 RepID=UPI0022B1A930|nr:general transcriptional corepressor trfA-like [Crassostrea angulata]
MEEIVNAKVDQIPEINTKLETFNNDTMNSEENSAVLPSRVRKERQMRDSPTFQELLKDVRNDKKGKKNDKCGAPKIPTWAAVHYPEDDSTGVIYTNKILDLSSCEENAEILIRWTKDSLVPARIIAVSDSLEELEDAIKRFDEAMDEDEFDPFTDQAHVIQDVQEFTAFKENVPSQDTVHEEITATLTGQEKANQETGTAETITPLQEPSSSDMPTQEVPEEISMQEDASKIVTDTEAQERAIEMQFLPASTEMDTQPASKEITYTDIGIQTACSDPSMIAVGTQTECEQVSKAMSTQTEPLEDQDLENTSFPLLNLSEYLTTMDDPYIQRQHRMMKQVEDHNASLKRIHEKVDKIEALLKKIVHQPKEAEPYNNNGIEQPTSAAAGSKAASVCSSAGNMLASSLWTSTLKRLQTPAYKPSKTSESATPQKLPKSIFASVESLASSSSNSLSTHMSSSAATIKVAKSIFRSIDFLAASDCPSSAELLYTDKSSDITEETLVVTQQRKPVNSLGFAKMCEEESFGALNSEDDRDGPMEIGSMRCEDIRNSKY